MTLVESFAKHLAAILPGESIDADEIIYRALVDVAVSALPAGVKVDGLELGIPYFYRPAE